MARAVLLLVTYVLAIAVCIVMIGLAFAWHQVFLAIVWVLAGGYTAARCLPDGVWHLTCQVHWRRHVRTPRT